MALYQVRFLAHSEEVFGREQFEAEDDASAIEHARQRLKSPWGKAHEIWHADRLVHRENYK